MRLHANANYLSSLLHNVFNPLNVATGYFSPSGDHGARPKVQDHKPNPDPILCASSGQDRRSAQDVYA